MDRSEERALAADAAAQERGPGGRAIGYQSPGFIRAVHPEHGEPVCFVPGELLPEWVVEALQGGRGHMDPATGVMTIERKAGQP